MLLSRSCRRRPKKTERIRPRSRGRTEEATISSAGTLSTYLRDIQRIPLLSREEEQACAYRILEGDPEARDQMVQANLRLVVSIAKGYTGKGLPIADLIEDGNLGLLRAVERFDPAEECRFSTYATWWIKQSIRRSLVNSVRTVRVPSYLAELITRWRRAERELQARTGRAPSFEEICEALEVDPKQDRQILRAYKAAQLTTTSLSSDAAEGLADIIEDQNARQPEDEVFDTHEQARLADLLEAVDERESSILRMRFGFGDEPPLTLREIGSRLGITRERVRQIQNDALAKLHVSLLPGRGGAD